MTKPKESALSRASRRRVRKTTEKSASRRRARQAIATAAPEVVETGSAAATARPSKKAIILTLLQRPTGAAIGDLTEATGWQGHSVRAALTGLRKEGKELVRGKDQGGVTHYRLAAAA